MLKICIFCAANDHIDADFFKIAHELGVWMAQKGHTLVFGGCNMGLMQCIAQAVHSHGGQTIGVIPAIVEKDDKVSPDVDIEIACDNLSDRKELMINRSDIIIALPGGIGTLDEIFTVAASSTIGYHHKKVILYNIKGFWNKLIAMLDDMQHRGMIRGDYHQYIVVANNIQDIENLL